MEGGVLYSWDWVACLHTIFPDTGLKRHQHMEVRPHILGYE